MPMHGDLSDGPQYYLPPLKLERGAKLSLLLPSPPTKLPPICSASSLLRFFHSLFLSILSCALNPTFNYILSQMLIIQMIKLIKSTF